MKDSSKKFLWSPLGGFAEGFLAELSARGYSPRSSEAHLFLMKHLSRWLAAQGLSAHDLTNELAVRFVAERRENTTCAESLLSTTGPYRVRSCTTSRSEPPFTWSVRWIFSRGRVTPA